MTEFDEEYDGLRRALHAGAARAPSEVDPAAARRAGDARMRTRTAITTSLAFSLVIFAGLGSVYFAAHRSRPSSLGSDSVPATAGPSPSISPTSADRVVAGFLAPVVVAGVPESLHIGGVFHEATYAVIHWGDGTAATYDGGLVACMSSPSDASAPLPVDEVQQHTYPAAGAYTVIVTVTGCTSSLKASFKQIVLPAAPPSPPAPPVQLEPPVRTSARPTLSPSVAPTPSGTPTASVKPSRTASPTSTPTSELSVSASPSGRATAAPSPSVVSASPTETQTPH